MFEFLKSFQQTNIPGDWRKWLPSFWSSSLKLLALSDFNEIESLDFIELKSIFCPLFNTIKTNLVITKQCIRKLSVDFFFTDLSKQ